MLTLDDLRFFAVVAARDSLADAARKLDVTPPAVSQRLAALERRLGVRLVERCRGGTQLTTEGEMVAMRARVVLDELDDLQSQMAAHRDELFGPLRIAAPLGFGRRHVAPVVAEFQALHPKVTIDLFLFDRLREPVDSFHLVVHIGGRRDSAESLVKLAPNDRVVCAAPEYLARRGEPSTAADLRRHDCLALRENKEDATLWRFVRKDRSVTVRVEPRLASNDGGVVREWAVRGLGVMVRSEWDVADDLRAGGLVRILADHRAPAADVVALLGARHSRLARTQSFLDHLRHSLSPPPWRAAIPAQTPEFSACGEQA